MTTTREMGVEEARKQLGDLVIDAQRVGTFTTITRNGKPAATLVGALDADLLARVGAYATGCGCSPAAAIEGLLGEALAVAQPYTVTVRDIATGRRETESRHASLGAAVEAMRNVEDLEGMPSYQARVEHDGRPVDTETMEK